MEKTGVIYILTNPSFPEYVKIGYADNIDKRLQQLNRSECIPFAFRVYATYEVNSRLSDLKIHSIIDKLNPNLRSIENFNGKQRVREFYAMSPEDAYSILEAICKQFLIRENRAGAVEPPFDLIGKYYYYDPKTRTNGEFDIVTQDPNGFAFYEAKFRKEPISEGMIRDEMRQVQNSGLACYKYGFFSRSGFSCQPEGSMVFYTLADLYA